MPDDMFMFWFIHIMLGIIIPILALTGCCRREEEKLAKQQQQTAAQEPH